MKKRSFKYNFCNFAHTIIQSRNMKKLSLTFTITLSIIMAIMGCRRNPQTLPVEVLPTEDQTQFVAITDAVPDAILEIRYYSTYKFVGARVHGYHAPVA